jgi:hypothetical protein
VAGRTFTNGRSVLRSLSLAVTLIMAAAAFTGDDPVVGEEATVQIQSQHLFPRPVFYSTPVAELGFGDVVTLLEESEDWFRVRTASGTTGWIHSTSVTGAVLSGGAVGSGSGEVTSDEIMLAGRGFNAEMEESYSGSNPSLSFTGVDQMERIEVDPDDIYGFLVAGQLIEPEEGYEPPPVPDETSQEPSAGGSTRR